MRGKNNLDNRFKRKSVFLNKTSHQLKNACREKKQNKTNCSGTTGSRAAGSRTTGSRTTGSPGQKTRKHKKENTTNNTSYRTTQSIGNRGQNHAKNEQNCDETNIGSRYTTIPPEYHSPFEMFHIGFERL